MSKQCKTRVNDPGMLSDCGICHFDTDNIYASSCEDVEKTPFSDLYKVGEKNKVDCVKKSNNSFTRRL